MNTTRVFRAETTYQNHVIVGPDTEDAAREVAAKRIGFDSYAAFSERRNTMKVTEIVGREAEKLIAAHLLDEELRQYAEKNYLNFRLKGQWGRAEEGKNSPCWEFIAADGTPVHGHSYELCRAGEAIREICRLKGWPVPEVVLYYHGLSRRDGDRSTYFGFCKKEGLRYRHDPSLSCDSGKKWKGNIYRWLPLSNCFQDIPVAKTRSDQRAWTGW